MQIGVSLGVTALQRTSATTTVTASTAEVASWLTRVTANSGTASQPTVTAMDNFVNACKSASIWTKLTRINLLAGGQLAAAQVPLVVGGGSALETLSNIVSGDYAETGSLAGLKGNGTSKYFDTGFNPSTLSSLTNFSLWAYAKGIEAGGTSRILIGSQDSGANQTLVGWGSAGTVEVGAIGTLAAAEYSPSGTPVGKEGFLGISANGSRVIQYYQNGAAVNPNNTATGVFSAGNLYGLAVNTLGSATLFSTRYMRSYAIALGMSAADATAFNTAMQDFQTALSRNV